MSASESTPLTEAVLAAYRLALTASKSQTRYRGSAYVDWSALHELRKALLAAGIGKDAGWQFPLAAADVYPTWRKVVEADHRDPQEPVYDELRRVTYTPAGHKQLTCEGGTNARGCKLDAHWVGPDGRLACDKHVPLR